MAADQEVEEDEELLVDERDEDMVSLTGSGQPINRTARFLRPTATSDELKPPISNPQVSAASAVVFKGWFHPTPSWRQWVDKLRPFYSHLWKRAAIFDAIQASTFLVRRDPSSISAAARHWSGETNTFHFRWAEATITLEDVMVVGGFSVLGEPVRTEAPLAGELRELELKLAAELTTFIRSPSKKATHYSWTNHFIRGDAGEAEHAAFLSVWLSRFVFPETSVRRSMFPIAVRLARGVRIALAPAVLATLYRDLRAMRDRLDGWEGAPVLQLLAPLRILQLWLWERFTLVRPEDTNYVDHSEPRAARWHNVGKKFTEPSLVRKVLRSAGHFQWRPYAIGVDNWCIPGIYKDDGGWFCSDGAAGDEALESLSRCLRPSELVGLDCIEQYLPHRVAMQFGLDQDVPGSVPRADSSWVVAWETYDLSEKKVRLYVPPRLFESDVTCRYATWWKRSMKKQKRSTRTVIDEKKVESKHCMKNKERSSSNVVEGMKGKKRKMIEGNRGKNFQSSPKIKKRRFQNVSEPTLSEWLTLRNCSPKIESKQKSLKLKIILKSPENVIEQSGNSRQTNEEELNDPLDRKDSEIEKEIEMTNANDSSCESTIKFQMEETKNTELRDKEAADQLDRQNKEVEKEIKMNSASGSSSKSTGKFQMKETEDSTELVGRELDDQLDRQNKEIEKDIEMTSAIDSSCKSAGMLQMEETVDSTELVCKEVEKEIVMTSATDSLCKSAGKVLMAETEDSTELVCKELDDLLDKQNVGIEKKFEMTSASDYSCRSTGKFQMEETEDSTELIGKDTGEQLGMRNKEIEKEIEMTSDSDSSWKSTVKFQMGETEDSTELGGKEPGDQLDMWNKEIEKEIEMTSANNCSCKLSVKFQMEVAKDSIELVGGEPNDQLDSQNKEIEKEIEMTSVSDSSCTSTVKFQREEIEDSTELVDKEPGDQLDMRNKEIEKEIEMTSTNDSSCKSTVKFQMEETKDSTELVDKEPDDQLDRQNEEIEKEIEKRNASDSSCTSIVKLQGEETEDNTELVDKEPDDQLDRQNKEIEKEIEMMNASDSLCKATNKFQMEEIEVSTKLRYENAELDIEIKKLKEEVAVLQAKIVDLESES